MFVVFFCFFVVVFPHLYTTTHNLTVFGPAKLCKFNGQHYCYECHRDDERVIPARVLFNWDFRAHKVCLASCEYLDGMERAPVLNVEEVNKTLYRYIPAMEEAMVSLTGNCAREEGENCFVT